MASKVSPGVFAERLLIPRLISTLAVRDGDVIISTLKDFMVERKTVKQSDASAVHLALLGLGHEVVTSDTFDAVRSSRMLELDLLMGDVREEEECRACDRSDGLF